MKSIRIFSVALLSLAMLAAPASASVIEGVRFAKRITAHDTQLHLRGTGLLRYKVVFKGYVAALYLEADQSERLTPDRVLSDVPRRLEIEYFWAIPADVFAQATVDGIARNTDAATHERLKPRIAATNALYEAVNPGDRYTITYVPGHGTDLALNGRVLGNIEGADFAAAFFAIWLGEQPLDESLRNQLLASN